MDPSMSAQQAAQPQQPVPVTPKPETLAQMAQTPTAQPAQPISGHPEQGPIQSAAVSENQGSDEIVPPAKEVEMQPTVPEVAVEQSVEHVVEKSADQEKPELPKEVQKAGVTLSGPGVPIDENAFGVKSLPMTYEEAILEEKKHPKLNDSKHWFAELVAYVWHKLDPNIEKKGVKK